MSASYTSLKACWCADKRIVHVYFNTFLLEPCKTKNTVSQNNPLPLVCLSISPHPTYIELWSSVHTEQQLSQDKITVTKTDDQNQKEQNRTSSPFDCSWETSEKSPHTKILVWSERDSSIKDILWQNTKAVQDVGNQKTKKWTYSVTKDKITNEAAKWDKNLNQSERNRPKSQMQNNAANERRKGT